MNSIRGLDPAAGFAASCQQCPIRYRAVCAYCEEDELTRLEAVKYYRSFQPGQVIVWAGDRLDFVASVVAGVASLTQTLEDGRTQMVGLLLPSDFLGRPGRDLAAHTVTAVTDIQLCCFRREPFERLLRDVPHIASRLLEMTLDELDAAREWLVLLGRKTAREKIASLLVGLARREALARKNTAVGQIELELPLTREAMADYLGVTLETVSRQISALRREGLIELAGKRRLIVRDVQALLDQSGDDNDGGLLI
ncbi:MAG: Crp/Fnr family transcriptional regulator [Paracoccus sp. (in: a-proteobacteria)]|nr:Crp/Fnr family transcriptional regulator [Paracoccus sp. (in: a-proteobacteria)]